MVNVGLANDGPNSNADTGKMILLGKKPLGTTAKHAPVIFLAVLFDPSSFITALSIAVV